VSESTNLSFLLLSKLEEQVDRAVHLLDLVPPDRLEWQPIANTLRLCEVLGHLLECLAGVCATLYALNPGRLDHFVRLRELPVNHCCKIDEARQRMTHYLGHIKEGFALVNDDDLRRNIPTVFVTRGEAVITILLGNLEHFINHKYQLFFYLKLLGVELSTSDLYKLK
jgi:hypothetical protein